METSKTTEVRRKEIIDVAERLFSVKGYDKTSIVNILKEVGIAKGTFYYYFTSKEEVLDAIIKRIVDADVAAAEKIVYNNKIPVLEKLFLVLLGQKPQVDCNKEKMIAQAHLPENAQMHQKTLVRSITAMAPVLTKIVEQGIQEGVMHTPYPQQSMEFLLVAGQTIFDEGLFSWPEEEFVKRVQAFIYMMETSLGAAKGSFDYMARLLDKEN